MQQRGVFLFLNGICPTVNQVMYTLTLKISAQTVCPGFLKQTFMYFSEKGHNLQKYWSANFWVLFIKKISRPQHFIYGSLKIDHP